MIHQQVKNINEWFVRQIIAGNYHISKRRERYVEIVIEGMYYFTFWFGERERGFEQFTDVAKNFMQLQLSEWEKTAAKRKMQEKTINIDIR